GELAAHTFDVCVRLIDLVDRHDDRHLRGARVVDRFFRLRHDTVIRGDDEHDDVSHFRAARSHHRESLVAWRVEEDDLSSALLDVIRPDVLRNAARLAGGDIRFANRIEPRRFAVVDVTHDGDHGPTRCGALRAALLDRFELDGRFARTY